MKAEEYFGDWIDIIDKQELHKVVTQINKINSVTLCPSPKHIFKAFRVCPYKDCKVVFLGQDSYLQKRVATGILFGNSEDTPENKLSTSLQIVKEAAINYEIPHNRIEFDNTLESWAKQGILMINTTLTWEAERAGIHFELWKPFMSKLIHNLSYKNNGIVYVLFGSQVQIFKNDIVDSLKTIEVYHPAYFSRRGTKMPPSIFTDINQTLKKQYNYQIEFYKETEYGVC